MENRNKLLSMLRSLTEKIIMPKYPEIKRINSVRFGESKKNKMHIVLTVEKTKRVLTVIDEIEKDLKELFLQSGLIDLIGYNAELYVGFKLQTPEPNQP